LLGATLVGLAFVLPTFLMVLALSALYVAYGGLWWMQAAFYGIGAAVIAIIAIQAYNLARRTNKSDALSWGIFAVLAAVTAATQAEIAEFFIVAGLVVLLVRAWPGPGRAALFVAGGVALGLSILFLERVVLAAGSAGQGSVLTQILLFFTKAGAFAFGSGLAIVPFLHQGVVGEFGWLARGPPRSSPGRSGSPLTPGSAPRCWCGSAARPTRSSRRRAPGAPTAWCSGPTTAAGSAACGGGARSGRSRGGRPAPS
jgi:chromate transporter